VVLLCSTSLKMNAQETNYKTYSVFIYNFMKYIEWPSTASAKKEFTIYVVGNSKISSELEQLAKSKKIKDKTIVVKKTDEFQNFQDADLIYLSDNKSAAIKDLQAKLKDKEILIVGEREDLARKGAAISFAILESDELSFDINLKELKARKLQISGSLIKLGNVVAE
jgi:hypothetical protein